MLYIVTELGPVSHNGQCYSEGEEISDFSPEQTEHLVNAGIIKVIQPAERKHSK